ncbi:peptide/nickel transport system permease protein [Ruegeria halocynthiae]|uniref:Peptide/nickel transport system permease protein n=1 Tax=Ruegeria halocynthiae TaxID=985054 RepID=A0A1H2U108_9RHOB|nr:ABC transporter permease [Ruegeria halocynthiae]SDW49239.1 peptide/nickel transport system permease protein [Ruegeria halocynthiae]
MEPLTWTGSIAFLNPILALALGLMALSIVVWMLASMVLPEDQMTVNPDGTLTSSSGLRNLIQAALRYSFLASVGLAVAYVLLGILMGTSAGIIGAISQQFLPVWLSLIFLYAMSIAFKRKLGLYGKLFDSPIGMIGFGLVMFWVFTGIFGALDLIVTHDPLSQISGMKNKVPGTPLPNLEDGQYAWYLLGGDNLARDVFSRMVKGAWIVVQIAPLATMFAFMVGITLGLPAGYYSGRLDTLLSFLANLILAFPVILLFYLLVTPEIVATGVPNYMAAILFVFPIIFLGVLLNSRYYTRPNFRTPLLIGVLGVALWLYLSLISTGGYIINTDSYRIWGLPTYLDLFDIPGGILVVFVSVVFVNSPTVFRIVRGLALDIKTRDYVAAAQTRGEGPWYIMLWEILPNARGPLIVDFCLRIGYTTILLGTLGFFGLGLPPESPDWGSTINEGRKLLSVYLHPALPPALALLSLVLGLNLLADGLREESLKD